MYLQKTSKISIAFYAKFNVKHLSDFCLNRYRIQKCTKKFNTLGLLTLQFMSYYAILFFESFFGHFFKSILEPSYNKHALSCNMDYYLDYLNEKSIFFAETKTKEKLSAGSIL